MGVIACLDLDPFLVGLVGRLRPDDTVVEVAPADLAGRSARRYTAVVASPGSGHDGHGAVTSDRLAERTVVVTTEGDGWVPSAHPGPVLRRPVDPAELRAALSTILPSGWWSAVRARLQAVSVAVTTDGVFSVARISASATASALVLADGSDTAPMVLVAALMAWSVLRVWVRQSSTPLVLVDVALATGAILLTGGTDSPFLLFAAVASAEVGYALPHAAVVGLVGAATVAGLVPLSVGLVDGRAVPADLVGWGTLIPLASVIGVLAQRIRAGQHRGNIELLEELHATLDRLSKQAQGVAGTLAVDGVVEQVLVTLREDLGAIAAVLLLGDGEVHRVAGAFGAADGLPPRVVLPAGARDAGLPPEVASRLPRGERVVARLRARGVDRGALVAVVPDGSLTRDTERELRLLATEATVALGNARLFESIRELTVDGERRRLARDLHDGVVQSLVHVRFELDLVGRMIDDPAARDIQRVRDVVGRAVDEVRATVNDLRSVRLSAGLGTALLTVAREYDTSGVRVVVDTGPTDALTPEAELQLLRIAQEAISNTVQHGQASAVYVRLWQGERHVHLQVLDDGTGIDPGRATAGRGVGLRAMQERAGLLGATLDLGPGADGGTCVQVDVPVGRTSP